MQLVFRPLVSWPRAKTENPTTAPFRSTWTATLDLLEREVDAIRTSRQRQLEVLLEVDAPQSAMRLDGGMRADARVGFHGVIVSFESKFGPKSFPCDQFNHGGWARGSMSAWQQNVRAVALGLEALRKVDRYGIANTGEQYTGWNALPPGRPMPAATMTVEDAARFIAVHSSEIDIRTDAWRVLIGDPDLVKARYRDAANKLHPDKGGDPALFAQLQEARNLLLSTVAV